MDCVHDDPDTETLSIPLTCKLRGLLEQVLDEDARNLVIRGLTNLMGAVAEHGVLPDEVEGTPQEDGATCALACLLLHSIGSLLATP